MNRFNNYQEKGSKPSNQVEQKGNKPIRHNLQSQKEAKEMVQIPLGPHTFSLLKENI